MCLNVVTMNHSKPSSVIVDGWKQFSGASTLLTFSQMGGVVKLDTWIKASEVKPPVDLRASDGKSYKAGFHAYADEPRDAYRHRRVYLRHITCTGTQEGKTCVIAQEMFVPSDQTAWPPMEPPTSPSAPSPASAPKKRLLNRLKGRSS